jgi:hypothetical protein
MVPMIRVELEGDGCWPELGGPGGPEVIDAGTSISMALLRGGMSSGRASVTVRIDLPDGRVVLAQASLAVLLGAAEAMAAAPGVVL